MEKKVRIYIVWTYLVFTLFIGLIGLVMLVLNMETLGNILQTVAAWTPTLVFLVMFKKIYPQEDRLQFIRRQFSEKIENKTLFTTIGVMLAIFLGTLLTAIVLYRKPISELMTLAPLPLLYMLPEVLISGPLGEELGWRAFLLTEVQKKYSLLKSGLIVGLIWGFWHFPLWLVSGYEGLDLLLYVLSFLVSIVCCSIIMTLLYNENKNLLIPIIIHFLNNYLLNVFTVDLIERLIIFAGFYILVTVSLMIIKRDKLKISLR